jgi:superfamily II DNA or RNA helicase
MIELPNLRDYQLEFVARLREDLRRYQRVIACMPTGAGKSTVAKYIIGSSYNRGIGKAVIAVHRRGLVDNIIDTFERQPYLPHGVVMSGRETSWKEPVQVASIDTTRSERNSDSNRPTLLDCQRLQWPKDLRRLTTTSVKARRFSG